MGRYMFTLIIGLLLPFSSFAAEAAGVTLPETTALADKELVLNGLGVRKATWFKVKVYVGALYLEQKTHNAAQILSSEGARKIVMHFVRDVGADKLKDGWTAGFKNNGADMAKLGSKIAQFNNAMGDIEEGQQIVLDFVGDKVDVSFAGAKKTTLEGDEFQKALLSIWLGASPPNEELKQGMLGKS